jgi:hypothetical protein
VHLEHLGRSEFAGVGHEGVLRRVPDPAAPGQVRRPRLLKHHSHCRLCTRHDRDRG